MNEKVAGVGPFKKHFHTFSLPSVAVKKSFTFSVPGGGMIWPTARSSIVDSQLTGA